MDTEHAEEILQGAAKDGILDVFEWPRTLEFILTRLEQNVYKQFPLPQANLSERPSASDQTITPPKLASQATQTSTEDSALPVAPPAPTQTAESHGQLPLSSLVVDSSGTDGAETRQQNHISTDASRPALVELPQPILTTYNYVRSTLTNSFSKNPPHTIQRLAELILFPRQHYRYLPRYLNALDRTVSVSSGPAVFLASATSPNGLSNGASMAHHQSLIDDNEALGGALLTPIPWLRNRSDSSPAGADVSTSSPRSPTSPSPSGAVTQGELLRQEQEASGPPAPVASLPSRILTINRAMEAEMQSSDDGHAPGVRQIPVGDAGIALEDDPDEEPHALGPEAITPEDMGPQAQDPEKLKGHILDLEAAVGRPGEGRGPSTSPEIRSDEHVQEEEKDAEGDVAMVVDEAVEEASDVQPTSSEDPSEEKE